MSKGKILIVDDEADIAEVLGDRLEAWGFQVRIVGSARGCYAAVEEETPDLILMDIQMPEINGIEALVALKARHPVIPVLMITASTVQKAVQESLDRGAAGFLLKPFDPEDLRRKVNEVLRGGEYRG